MEWIISDPAYLSTMLAAKPVLLALRQTYSKLLEKLKFIRRFYLVTEVQAPPSIALRGALGNASVSADVLAAKSQLLPVVMFIIKCIIVAVHYSIQSSSGIFRSPTNSANVDSQQYKPASKSPLLVTMFLFKCIISAGVVGCLRGGFDRRRCAWDRRVRAANPSCLSDVDSQGTHPKGVSSNSSVRKRADGLRSAAHPRFVIIWFFQIMLFLIRCIFAVSVGYIGACGLPRLIRALGFGPTGVLPNTAASKLQGRYKGVVPKSGYFGVLQKWGVSGVPQWLTLAVFFVATGIGYVYF
ncbi:hypothetical protein MRX96_001208 [Rhipicephalus microplus]